MVNLTEAKQRMLGLENKWGHLFIHGTLSQINAFREELDMYDAGYSTVMDEDLRSRYEGLNIASKRRGFDLMIKDTFANVPKRTAAIERVDPPIDPIDPVPTSRTRFLFATINGTTEQYKIKVSYPTNPNFSSEIIDNLFKNIVGKTIIVSRIAPSEFGNDTLITVPSNGTDITIKGENLCFTATFVESLSVENRQQQIQDAKNILSELEQSFTEIKLNQYERGEKVYRLEILLQQTVNYGERFRDILYGSSMWAGALRPRYETLKNKVMYLKKFEMLFRELADSKSAILDQNGQFPTITRVELPYIFTAINGIEWKIFIYNYPLNEALVRNPQAVVGKSLYLLQNGNEVSGSILIDPTNTTQIITAFMGAIINIPFAPPRLEYGISPQIESVIPPAPIPPPIAPPPVVIPVWDRVLDFTMIEPYYAVIVKSELPYLLIRHANGTDWKIKITEQTPHIDPVNVDRELKYSMNRTVIVQRAGGIRPVIGDEILISLTSSELSGEEPDVIIIGILEEIISNIQEQFTAPSEFIDRDRPTTLILYDKNNIPYCAIETPGHICPILTDERRQAVYVQLLRYFEKREPSDDALTRMVYITLAYMPLEIFIDAISKALPYMTDYELLIDRSHIFLIDRVFEEQWNAFLNWHVKNGRNIMSFSLSNIDRIKESVKRQILLEQARKDEIIEPVAGFDNKLLSLVSFLIIWMVLGSNKEKKRAKKE